MATVKEIDAVSFVLEKDWPEEASTKDVAKSVIKAIRDMESTNFRPIGPPLSVGMAFKTSWSSKTHYVAWIGVEGDRTLAWVVSSDSNYGWLGNLHSSFMRASLLANVRQGAMKRVEADDGTVSQVWVPGTVEKILTSEIGMVPGDRITFRQDGQYEIEAVFSRGVLMRERLGGLLYQEENANIKKYYRDGWR